MTPHFSRKSRGLSNGHPARKTKEGAFVREKKSVEYATEERPNSEYLEQVRRDARDRCYNTESIDEFMLRLRKEDEPIPIVSARFHH